MLYTTVIGGVATSIMPPYYHEYTQWANQFNKVYSNTNELEASYNQFVESIEFVHNHSHALFDVELNQFADTQHPTNNVIRCNETVLHTNDVYQVSSLSHELPENFEWVSRGAVLPTRNQHACGSCYTFSATGALSGKYFLKTGQLVRFSESQLVDCSSQYDNDGCDGGLQINCFKYYIDHGAEAETNYPYTPEDGRCNFQYDSVVVKVRSYKQVYPGEYNLKMALYHNGPLAIQMDASRRSFQLYHTGIYSDPECSNVKLDHAVLLVGWGNGVDDTKYWTVQNSWGTDWGEDGGFFRIDISHDCGISASGASFPQL